MGISGSYFFQHGNDPKHAANITRLEYIVKHLLQMSSQSPDLSPIGNLWHILDMQIRKNKISKIRS